MKILLCGAGQVGWAIARHLSLEGNDITVIDRDPALVARVTDSLEVQGIVGAASFPSVLAQAGARDADMIIAATSLDEVNMVACQVAHSVFGITRKIARLREKAYLDPTYSDLYRRDHMPIDVIISPEREVAQAVVKRLYSPATFEREAFLDENIQLLGLNLAEDCPVLGTPIRQLSELFVELSANIVAIRREGKLRVADHSDSLFAGDQIYILVRADQETRTLEIFGMTCKKPERVVLIGGGIVGLDVALKLEEGTSRIRAKMIELDRERAEYVADRLNRTVVLHGDGLSQDILTEAHIEDADSVICLTNNDQTNLLAAVRAKAVGSTRTISLVNDPTLFPMLAPLNVDAFVNPRASTVSSILKHIRAGQVSSVYTIGDGEGEIIQVDVLPSSQIAGRRIADIDFPEGVRIGAISKNNVASRPTGDTRIDVDDRLVIFVLARDVMKLQRLLQVSVDFF